MVLEHNQDWDSYLIEGTDILKNNFNIMDFDKLKEIEKQVTTETLTLLYLEPVLGNFDSEHLKEIHRRIFEPIYPFAGKIRTCSLAKTGEFCAPQNIQKDLQTILKNMNIDFENISSFDQFAFKLADYYSKIIWIHPFREGNGRSIRVFFREFVLEKSKNCPFGPLDLDYTKMNKENLMLGTVQRYIYNSYIEMEFRKGLVKIENNKKL